MKNFEHPEFFILHKLQLLQEKYPDLSELAALTKETQKIINENALSMVQAANLYVLLGKEGDLLPETKKKLALLYDAALKACE